MKKKRVAVVLVTDPKSGGGYRYALMVAECLKELPMSHYELLGICGDAFWRRWCRKHNIKYVVPKWSGNTLEQMEKNLKYPIYPGIYNTYFTEFGEMIRKEGIDLLIFTEQSMYIPNLPVKIITPVHDLMHRYEPDFPEVKEDYQRRELLFQCQAKYADYILTDSKLGRKQFVESYLRKAKKRPHIVSLPYVVPNHIIEAKEELIQVPIKYVFYPAQFWKQKNQIILLGFVNDGNMIYLYRHATAMIMPSYFGPTNIPPLEAMALGCPVAISNKYAMPEQVGQAGLLFNPDSPEEIAECIRRIWIDGELGERMIAEGYRRVQRWTEQDFKNRISKVVKRCLA